MANGIIDKIQIGSTTYDINADTVDGKHAADFALTTTTTSSAGAHEYVQKITITGGTSSGSGSFVTGVGGGGGSLTITGRYLNADTQSAVTGVGANGTATAITGLTTTKDTVLNAMTPTGHANAVTGIDGGSGGFTATYKYLYANSGNAASASHTHTVTATRGTSAVVSGGVTYTGRLWLSLDTAASASTISVLTRLMTAITPTGDIIYMESATHTHTGASVTGTESVITAITCSSITAVTDVSAGSTASVLTGVKATGYTNVITWLNSGIIQGTLGLPYLEDASFSPTPAIASSTGTACTGVNPVVATITTRYIKESNN